MTVRYQQRVVGVYDRDLARAIYPTSDPDAWADYVVWLRDNIPDPMPIAPPPTRAELAAHRDELIAGVNAVRDEHLAAGVTYQGHVYDTDARSIANLTSTVAAVAAGVPLPGGFTWRTADNQNVAMDAETLVGLAGTVLAYSNACYENSWALKAAIAAADDPATVDTSAGWP